MHSRSNNALLLAAAALAYASAANAAAADATPIGYASVAAARAALSADRTATTRDQQGWTVVASRENGAAVEWFFTPETHAVYPAVIKRTVVEEDGVGMIEIAALCETASQDPCDQLIEDFRQTHKVTIKAPRVERVSLDINIAQNDHDRVRVNRLVAEDGKAAEIRMDGQLKAVFVPTLDEKGAVTVWAAMYEYNGRDFSLAAEPRLVTPGAGTAAVELAAPSGNRFAFSITQLPLPKQD